VAPTLPLVATHLLSTRCRPPEHDHVGAGRADARTPTLSPAGGAYTTDQTVTITGQQARPFDTPPTRQNDRFVTGVLRAARDRAVDDAAAKAFKAGFLPSATVSGSFTSLSRISP